MILRNSDRQKGVLIDLDLAKEKDSDSDTSRAPHRTGTLEFMAIEVLKGMPHTWRHDLESFFYVLIWICIIGGKPKPGGVPELLQMWSWKSAPNTKYAQMTSEMDFEELLGIFGDKFGSLKGMVREMRKVLFGPFGGGFYSTPVNHHDMYSMFIKVLDDECKTC